MALLASHVQSTGKVAVCSCHFPIKRQKLVKKVSAPARQKGRHMPLEATGTVTGVQEQHPWGVLLETDKVVVDTHASGHRVAFNEAFREVGFSHIHWSKNMFSDLLRSSAATPDSLVATYFNSVGWPVTVPAHERRAFVEKVQSRKAAHLARMVAAAEIPLRTGVASFLEEAAANGARLAMLAGTCSSPQERIVDAALAALGPALSEEIRVFTCPKTSTSQADDEAPLSIEESFAAATALRKHAEAQTFLEVVNRSKLGADWRQNAAMHEPGQLAARNIAEGIHIDPGLLASTQRFSGLSPQWISACSATLDVPHSRFAFLGGTNSVLKAAKAARMLSVAVPAALSGRGQYVADLQMDGYGPGGGVTWRLLVRQMDARSK